jgi:tetratricopeptide (TPR) repeat protein
MSRKICQNEDRMKLPDEIYEKVVGQSEQGNQSLDSRHYVKALTHFEAALNFLPEPKVDWEAYTWLKASMADAYFHLEDFSNCAACAYDALNGPDAVKNPFIHLRLGQALFEQSQMERAESELLQSYMLAGAEIFSEDSPKYRQYMESKFIIT